MTNILSINLCAALDSKKVLSSVFVSIKIVYSWAEPFDDFPEYERGTVRRSSMGHLKLFGV